MSSRIFYYQNQSVVQKRSQGVQLFSRESKAGPSVRRQSMQEYQGISILFFSRQSKARDQHLVFLKSKQSKCGQDKLDSKMVDKSVDQERENQCKAEIFEIKETSSAQCPVGLKGRRPQAQRGATVPLSHQVRSGGWESMISANGGLPAHRYTPQVTPRRPRGSRPASPPFSERCYRSEVIEERTGGPQWDPIPLPHVPRTHGGPTHVVGVPHAPREG